MKNVRIGPDGVRLGRVAGPKPIEVKRSGGTGAGSSDCESCEHLDDQALAFSRRPRCPLPGRFVPAERGKRSEVEKRVIWQTEILRNVMRRICRPATTRLSQTGRTGLRL
jgi:hypothetical protein